MQASGQDVRKRDLSAGGQAGSCVKTLFDLEARHDSSDSCRLLQQKGLPWPSNRSPP